VAAGENPQRFKSEAAFAALWSVTRAGLVGQVPTSSPEPLGQPSGQPRALAHRCEFA
jgi:hypothetical protein